MSCIYRAGILVELETSNVNVVGVSAYISGLYAAPRLGGFFCPQGGTLDVHAYLIIVININIMSFNTKGRGINKTIRRA